MTDIYIVSAIYGHLLNIVWTVRLGKQLTVDNEADNIHNNDNYVVSLGAKSVLL